MDPHAHPGPVADGYAQRRRAFEDAWLSPLAARSWPAQRARPEDDCGLRTPLQRDRDRIVHSKAFRRLKHKTQVFVAPEGDHFRTRLTHTLEVTQISRTVARALRLNEDLTEAIGLGHDLGHPAFGHIGEDVLDDCLRGRFGTGFRHYEHSLRVVDVLELDGAGLNLCDDVRDGIARHSGRAPMPRTLEGRIVRLVDRVAYINHDIDDALRAGVLHVDELPAEPIAVLGDTGSRRIDALVHDLVEHSDVAGDIVQGETVGGAMDRLRTFMFDHVYLGPVARREHAKIDRVVRTLFEYYVAEPDRIPDGGGSPDADLAQRVTDWLAGMTDRYCIRAFEALSVPEAFALYRLAAVARYTDESRDRVRDAVDMVDLVGSRVELRRAGVNRFEGLCPFHDERTPSFGINPAEKLYYCFGCGEGGDAFKFVQETEGVGFAGALEYLADRYGVALEVVEEDPAAARRRAERERLLELLERTAAFYVRYLWDSEEASHAREYLAGRGLDEGALREFRVGYAPSAWDKVLVASRRAGFSDPELVASGLASRSQKEGRTYDRFRRRIMFPLCDQRGRVLGFGARAMGADQKPKYLNSSDGLVFHKGRHLFGADIARTPATKAAEVIVAEGYTDVIAMHQAGMRNTVGLMGTALTDEQVGELARLAPTVLLALDADAAGQEAMLRGARVAARRNLTLRVVPLPVGSDPADLVAAEGARAMADRVEASVPFVRFRVERELAAADLSRAEGKDAVIAALRPVFRDLPASAMREELVGLVADRTELAPALVASWLAQAPARAEEPGATQGNGAPQRRPAMPQPALDAAGRAERAFLAQCLASPAAGRAALAEMDIEAEFSSELTRLAAAHIQALLAGGSSELPDDDELATLVAALTVASGGMRNSEAAVEGERLSLEVQRVKREIEVAKIAASGDVGRLVARREELERRRDGAISRSMEETHSRD